MSTPLTPTLSPTKGRGGAPSTRQDEPLLAVEGLKTVFKLHRGVITAVDGVSFSLDRGETLAIVGESGCGKSITALSLIRLVPDPPGRIVAGTVKLVGVDLLALEPGAMRHVRGKDISMIFQEPMTSLNPIMTIGRQIAEVLRLHEGLGRAQARERTIEMLRLVRLAEVEQRLDEYPHQLSGGMRQRAMIAMALACNPKVLIADEPTTALDVTIQAQILDLLREMQAQFNLALLLITHDLGVIAETADRVAVMYAGRIVEAGPVRDIVRAPAHPYTRALLASIPGRAPGRRLRAIDGSVPPLGGIPSGCAFHPRCPDRFAPCGVEPPDAYAVGPDHTSRCHLHAAP